MSGPIAFSTVESSEWLDVLPSNTAKTPSVGRTAAPAPPGATLTGSDEPLQVPRLRLTSAPPAPITSISGIQNVPVFCLYQHAPLFR